MVVLHIAKIYKHLSYKASKGAQPVATVEGDKNPLCDTAFFARQKGLPLPKHIYRTQNLTQTAFDGKKALAIFRNA